MDHLESEQQPNSLSCAQYTESDWRRVNEEWAKSGKPQAVFCQQKNINYSRFVYWRGQFLTEAGKSRTQLTRIQVNKEQLSQPHQQTSIKLKLPIGVHVLISNGADPILLKSVLTILGVPTC